MRDKSRRRTFSKRSNSRWMEKDGGKFDGLADSEPVKAIVSTIFPSKESDSYVERIKEHILSRDPDQPEFLQAVLEVAGTLTPLFDSNPSYFDIFEILCEPERIISFRVPWFDDNNELQFNRGWRVQFNQALGPYSGGLRFDKSVNLSVLKFIGFEQIFKNALTGLPLGAGKGGSDFDPKGKSDREIQIFCQSFMTELSKHIGENIDIPAGDTGVGEREIGYLFGQFKRISRSHEGTLTGKGVEYGGTVGRSSATGFGLIYILENCLESLGEDLRGKRIVISGSGNFALFAAQKAIERGGIVLTLSDSSGFIFSKEGLTSSKLDKIIKLKTKNQGRLFDLELESISYVKNQQPWSIPCDIALPCATQNELDLGDAEKLIENGCKYIFEGANMPCTPKAIELIKSKNCVFFPGKAANAGGALSSGFEMTQNSERLYWSEEEFDEKLKSTMTHIWKTVSETASELGRPGDYMVGANCAGFKKVAEAMFAQGYC